MTYKFCKHCKKKFTKADILKSLPVEKHKNINSIWKRRKHCSDECTKKYHMKNRKMIAITYEVDKMVCECEIGQMKDTYSDVVKKLVIYYNSEGKKGTGLHKITPKHQPCACGCGEMAKPGNKYINGHNLPNVTRTLHEPLKRGIRKVGGLKMGICITCGLNSEKVSDKMPKHLLAYDSDGQPHWVDCLSLKRDKIANPEMYMED